MPDEASRSDTEELWTQPSKAMPSRENQTVRVPHPFRRHRKGWVIAQSATALSHACKRMRAYLSVAVMILAAIVPTGMIRAQEPPCGITNIKEASPLIYPPIARAAHIQGSVILMVTFAVDGSVSAIKDISGPQMLRRNSEEFVKGWHANSYGGSRQCPIVLTFAIGRESEDPQTSIKRLNLQHIRIVAETSIPTVTYSTASR